MELLASRAEVLKKIRARALVAISQAETLDLGLSRALLDIADTDEEAVELLLPSDASFDNFTSDLETIPPVAEQEDDAQASGRPVALGDGLPDGSEVLQTLAHLATLDAQVAHVQEVVYPLSVRVH